MTTVKTLKTNNKASLLDTSIRRLLFSNPSISIDVCRKVTDALKDKTEEEKELIRANLQESVTLYKEKAKDVDDKQHCREIFDEVKEHMQQWENVYGKASLADVLSLIDSTDIKLNDLGTGYLTPNSIFEMLKEFVVGQEAYARYLSLTIYTHILRTQECAVHMPKANLLVYGPSGVGKTYGIQVVANKLGIPFGVVNCNTVVPEGIVGQQIKDVLTQAYMKYKHLDNIIIFFDEFDKLFTENGHYNDRLLEELLLFLDDNNTISYPESYKAYSEYQQIPSKNITCIVGGMFQSLREAAKKRLSVNPMGFATSEFSHLSEGQMYELVNREDLKKVLHSDELYGRIGHFVRVNDLTTEQLVDILLQARETPLDNLRNYFSHHDVQLVITEEGAEEIATAAYNQKVGVRGLKSILWDILEDEMHDVDHGKRTICINREYVQKHLK